MLKEKNVANNVDTCRFQLKGIRTKCPVHKTHLERNKLKHKI